MTLDNRTNIQYNDASLIGKSHNAHPRDILDVSDIHGTKSRRLFRGEAKDLMAKYSTVDQSQPRNATNTRKRGVYDNMDYRDVTKLKANGMESPESAHYRHKMNYEALPCM